MGKSKGLNLDDAAVLDPKEISREKKLLNYLITIQIRDINKTLTKGLFGSRKDGGKLSSLQAMRLGMGTLEPLLNLPHDKEDIEEEMLKKKKRYVKKKQKIINKGFLKTNNVDKKIDFLLKWYSLLMKHLPKEFTPSREIIFDSETGKVYDKRTKKEIDFKTPDSKLKRKPKKKGEKKPKKKPPKERVSFQKKNQKLNKKQKKFAEEVKKKKQDFALKKELKPLREFKKLREKQEEKQ